LNNTGSSGETDERERALVRVLSGEEELAELDVPKVSRSLGFVPVYSGKWEVGLHRVTARDISLNSHYCFFILALVIDLYNLHHRFSSSSPIPLQ
jgi:hypothetical protein